MAQVNIRRLFEDKQERLALHWVAGADGADNILDSEEVNLSDKGLIGHLNLIHPNWVQVFSETEFDYLSSLSPAGLDEALEQIAHSDSLCLIVAGTEQIPQQLIDLANRTHTPQIGRA